MFFIVMNCEVRVKEAGANSNSVGYNVYNHSPYAYIREVVYKDPSDGNEYCIYSGYATSSRSSIPTVFVINKTKEALEIKLLKLQIRELENKLNRGK
jgi:hypothetical protein